jgi:hypothetical protein
MVRYGYGYPIGMLFQGNGFYLAYYNEYRQRGIADGGAIDSPTATSCAESRFVSLMPVPTNGYILAYNTQMRSLADSGNGFDARTLDCAAGRITPIIN